MITLNIETTEEHPITPSETNFWAQASNISRETFKNYVLETYKVKQDLHMVVRLDYTGPTTLVAKQ
jgi:hypothetical protein